MREELRNAINVILAECDKYKTCDGCEFHIVEDDFCKLDEWPFKWKFEDKK